MELTLEHIAEEVWTLKGAYNGISADVKEIKRDVRELHKKTERDKTDLIDRMQQNNTELIKWLAESESKLNGRISETETKLFGKIAETKTELIQWLVLLLVALGALNITAIWAILNFALK